MLTIRRGKGCSDCMGTGVAYKACASHGTGISLPNNQVSPGVDGKKGPPPATHGPGTDTALRS